MSRVTVVGLGYMGLPTALLLAQATDHEVVGVDIDSRKVEALQRGLLPFEEPGLAELWANTRARFTASTVPTPSDIFILALPTPIDANRACDLRYVEAAARGVAEILRQGDLLILESTVTPGTTQRLGAQLRRLGAPEIQLGYVSEKAIPGNTLFEMVHNDRVIGANSDEAQRRIRSLYQAFVKGAIHGTDLRVAEAAKLFENTFRDVNIALANELALLAEEHHIDVYETIRLANLHPRVNLLSPGPGVGGHCIAVDPWFLVEDKKSGQLIRTARAINDGRPGVVAASVHRALGETRQGKVCLLGAAYKADVDDDRESPAYEVEHALKALGYEVSLHDPHVRSARVQSDLAQALAGSSAVVLLVAHRAYQELALEPYGLGNAVFVDTCGAFRQRSKTGVGRYLLLGDGSCERSA